MLTVNKSSFLANKENKQHFITMLGNILEKAGCDVTHAKGDADLLIVQTTIAAAKSQNVTVVADDTDVLVLLCHHVDPKNTYDIWLQPEPKKNTKSERSWNIAKTKEALGHKLCKNLLFLHAIQGCDTTSQPYGIGKAVCIKKKLHEEKCCDVFVQEQSSKSEVISAGERALVLLYGGGPSDTLDKLRYRRFSEKVQKTSTFVQLKSLPPTSGSAKYHSLRAYYQVQVWLGNDALLPVDWGWKNEHARLLPIASEAKAAPSTLLQMIRCNCKTDCSTARCTCKKHNLECSSACGECRGSGCANSSPIDDEDSGSDNDES